MATTKHPLTGIELNKITRKRTSLNGDEAVTAYVMRFQGEEFNVIAHKLGTNPARVGEVLRGDVHPEARDKAIALLKASGTLLI